MSPMWHTTMTNAHTHLHRRIRNSSHRFTFIGSADTVLTFSLLLYVDDFFLRQFKWMGFCWFCFYSEITTKTYHFVVSRQISHRETAYIMDTRQSIFRKHYLLANAFRCGFIVVQLIVFFSRFSLIKIKVERKHHFHAIWARRSPHDDTLNSHSYNTLIPI